MGHRYEHLGVFEPNFIQLQLNLKSSRRKIVAALGRSVSTVSREIRRNGDGSDPSAGFGYDATGAGSQTAKQRRRGPVRLAECGSLRDHVFG
jgi:IS30 family transposase